MSGEIRVASAGGEYPVAIEAGGLAGVGELARRHLAGRRIALISDATVAGLYGREVRTALDNAGFGVELYTFPAGEASKIRSTWERLTDAMLADGFGRDSAVVALGGGVTGDLAGFVASTYMRGVPVLQLPTSIVAMVDSAVGGKTGVDTDAGKNLVGAFHPPVAVLIDPRVVRTLDEDQRSDGWVEAVKHGAIVDAAYFEALGADGPELVAGEPEATGRAVRRSVEIKSEVVAADEFESGRRMILNFGHTLGHALEAASAYALGHGRAVAAGMIMEAELGEELGVTEPGTAARLANALQAIQIDPEIPAGIEWSEMEDLLLHDKKARGGEPRFVLLQEIGVVHRSEGWSRTVPSGMVRHVFESSRLRR